MNEMMVPRMPEVVPSESIDDVAEEMADFGRDIGRSIDSLTVLEDEIDKVRNDHRTYRYKLDKVTGKMRSFLKEV